MKETKVKGILWEPIKIQGNEAYVQLPDGKELVVKINYYDYKRGYGNGAVFLKDKGNNNVSISD